MDIGSLADLVKSRVGAAVPLSDLFRQGAAGKKPKVVPITALPPSLEEMTQLSSGQRVSVALSPGLALERSISLPKAAASRAGAAIDLQMRQSLPSGGRGLVWRYGAPKAKGQQNDYTVYIFKEAQVAALLAMLKDRKVDVRNIRIDGVASQALWDADPKAAKRAQNWMAASALGVTVVGLFSILSIEQDRSSLEDINAARRTRIAALEQRLAAIEANATETQRQALAQASDMELFLNQSRRLELLADLTDALPDTVWVSELAIAADHLSFSGFLSGEVSAVVADIQSQGWAQSVQLEGPVSLDAFSGQSRFSVGLTILPIGAPG